MMTVVQTRIGAAYQAEIPPLLTPEERKKQREKIDERPPYRAQWTPAQQALSEDEIDEYLRGSRMKETETALRCLYDSGFDVHKAAQLLTKDRHQRTRAADQRTSALSDDDFEAAMLANGKFFSAIQRQHSKTQTSDLIARFYLWKTSTAYKKWHERAKTKKNKEAARLRQWVDAEGESDTSEDFHNEHCELCFTGGQLLCCDGCERAYHFSCVDPPIKDVPMGDWFCMACAAILGTSVEQRESDENEHCDEVVVVLHGPSSSHRKSLRYGNEEEEALMDDGVATDGNDTEEMEDAAVDDDHQKTTRETVIKQEPVVYQHARLYTPERPRQLSQAKRSSSGEQARGGTPTRSPLLTESTNRKRQRKIVAPRRIPQSEAPKK